MVPDSAQAADAQRFPNRMAVIYVPNGINMADWTPKETGRDFTLPRILKPLEPFQKDLLVLSGLSAHKADGPSGNHARALAVFLTGQRPPDNGGVQLGVSADQLAARVAGRHTRLPSLEIGCEAGAQSGRCDAPYSCAYTSNISWKSETTPLPPEVNPRLVFDRLFASEDRDNTDESRARRALNRKSVLDLVREDATELQAKLGGSDRRKIDEYLSAVREVEMRIGRLEKEPAEASNRPRPLGVPSDYKEHIRAMCDLLVLAWQADVTRVCTFLFANEFSNRPYPFINVRDGHHDLSHHGNDPGKLTRISDINHFHASQFAYLLEKLKASREGDGTLLDHCMIAYGSGNSDGNTHSHENLPVVLAGGGCGAIKPGRHVRYKEGTPLMNLWLAMLERMGAAAESFGDSNGRLNSLDG